MSITRRKKSFGQFASDYQKYRKTYRPEIYKVLFSLLDQTQSKINILDIGCGTGKATTSLLDAAPKKLAQKINLIGMDPDARMLAEAKKHGVKNKLPISYVEGSAEKLPFKKQTFDAVISATAFHWFATKQAFTKINGVIKPGGVCMVFWTWKKPKPKAQMKKMKSGLAQGVFKKYSWKSIDEKWRDPKEIKKLFLSAGFSGFTTVTIPYVEKDDIESYIGITKTVSSYTLLTPEQRKHYIKEITGVYKKIFGKRKYLHSNREMHICYGIKK